MSSGKDIASILNMPLTGIKSALFKKFLSSGFNENDLVQTLSQIRDTLPLDKQAQFDLEKNKAAYAIKKERAASSPNLSTDELQLLWAAHLLYLSRHSSIPLHKTKLWEQLTHCPDARHELQKHAFHIAKDVVNPKTHLHWGDPGTMFYYNLTDNEINIDFLGSLIMGFDETRPVIFHEIGHSKLTKDFTPRMAEIREEINNMQKKGGTLSPEEYDRLIALQIEWQQRHRIIDEAENIAVDRYTINAGHKLGQDFERLINVGETILTFPAKKEWPENPTPMDKYINLQRAIRMSVYKNNGYFEDTPAGWEHIGVRTDWIEALPKTPGGKPLTSSEAFKDLMELCGGPEGVEHLQPNTSDRMRGDEWLQRVTDDYSRRRNAVIEEIYTRFAEPLVKQLMPEAIKQTKEQAKQSQQRGRKGDVEGQGSQPGIELPPEKPANQSQSTRTSDDKSKDEGDTIETLVAQQQADQKNHDAIQSTGGDSQINPVDASTASMNTSGAGKSSVIRPPLGNWGDYKACAALFAPEIRRVRNMLIDIQKRQTQIKYKPSHGYSLLPEDGDMSRFDISRHTGLITRMLSGQDIDEKDARQFHTDEEQRIPAPIDVIIMVDASSSMHYPTDFPPINIGLQTACIVNEAAKGLNINVYVGLWGNDPPLFIAKPGDNPETIAKAIAGIKLDHGWGTNLAPAIIHSAQMFSMRKNKPDLPVGHTHFIFISDGDIYDEAAAKLTMERLCKPTQGVTADVAVINTNKDTQMDRVISEMERKLTPAKISLLHCENPKDAQNRIIDLLSRRVQMTGLSEAVPYAQKQKSFQRAWESMR